MTMTTYSACERRPIAWLGLLALVVAGCGPRFVTVERGPQAYYQTGYPVRDVSGELESAFRSIKRIRFSADYVTYIFPDSVSVTDADLATPAVFSLATDTTYDTLSKEGTAVVVSRNGNRITLLTAFHAVHYPSIRVSYTSDSTATSPRRVASVSVLGQQAGLILDAPHVWPFITLARDDTNDLALLGVQLPDTTAAAAFPPIRAAAGNPHRLSWGSFLYILGYPGGYRMVGRAIVSDPNRDDNGSFLTDGLWNEGVSGGAVLAVHGETGRLEWVAMARASAGNIEVRIQPENGASRDPENRLRYLGPLYIEEVLRIQYGITLSVPMSVIQEFLEQHRDPVSRRGYGLPRT